VTAHQVASLPAEAAEVIHGIVAEFETNQTDEARLAHDADKLEMLAQAREYQAMGIDTRRWIQSAVKALRTKTGGQLAQAILLADPQW
jgi:putative hydrolase of HD superfamily